MMRDDQASRLDRERPTDDRPEVVVSTEGRAGIVRLNRPKALNALTLGMVRDIAHALDRFAAEDAVEFVMFEGEGERAFCAGGDIRAIHTLGRTDRQAAARFWREEYELNARIAGFPKPVVALMRGITMGGGAGLSIHAGHRLVFDDTRFAMPEVGIGFVPDVGSTFRLSRAPGGLGRYLAFTGEVVNAADVIAAGLADAHVPVARLRELRAALAAAGAEDLDGVIRRFSDEPAPGLFATERTAIDRAFAGGVDATLDALAADDSPFAQETAKTILARSPTSLRLTELLLAEAERAGDLKTCLENEFACAIRTIHGEDFYEGVRAAVIDKDRNPRWSPASLSEVPPFGVDMLKVPAHFQPPFLPGHQACASSSVG